MTPLLFVAAAGIGASLRLLLREIGATRSAFPWETLAVNLTGAFLLGLLAGWSPPAATVVGTAGIGSLTTFSTFAGECVGGWRRNRTAAVVYLVVSIVAGIGLAWWGLDLAG